MLKRDSIRFAAALLAALASFVAGPHAALPAASQSRCLRLTPSGRWTTYWQRRISATYRMVCTRRSTRIPSRTFGSGSTPISG
jgi:hypothetical protein